MRIRGSSLPRVDWVIWVRSMARARAAPGEYVEEWKRLWEPDMEAIAFNGATCDPTKVDPKVLEWVRENCAQKPHFIKVIIASAVVDRPGLLRRPKSFSHLLVPSPFVERHFRNLGRVIRLENDAGVSWKVAFGSPTRPPVWQPGWCHVAIDNNIKPGDVIAFVLVGRSHFRFTHFDKHGNKINHSTVREPSSTREGGLERQVSDNGPSESHEAEGRGAQGEHVKPGGDSTRAPSNLCNEGQSAANSRGHSEHSQGKPRIEDDPPSRKRRRLCKIGEKRKKNDTHDSA